MAQHNFARPLYLQETHGRVVFLKKQDALERDSRRVWLDCMRRLEASPWAFRDADQQFNFLPAAFRYNANTRPDSSYDHHAGQSKFARSLISRSCNNRHTHTSGTEPSKYTVRSRNHTSFVTVFLRAHAVVFNGRSVGEFKILISSFGSGDLLETYIQNTGPAFQKDGIYIATINIAALLEHGEIYSSTECSVDGFADHTRWLFTHVMAIILRTRGPYVFSFIHVTLIFLLSCARNGKLPRPVKDLVPWTDVSSFMDAAEDMESGISLCFHGLKVLPGDSGLPQRSSSLLPKHPVDGGTSECSRGAKEVTPWCLERIMSLCENLMHLRK